MVFPGYYIGIYSQGCPSCMKGEVRVKRYVLEFAEPFMPNKDRRMAEYLAIIKDCIITHDKGSASDINN